MSISAKRAMIFFGMFVMSGAIGTASLAEPRIAVQSSHLTAAASRGQSIISSSPHNTWTVVPFFQVVLHSAATQSNGILYEFGGYFGCGENQLSSAAYSYNPVTQQTTQLPNLPTGPRGDGRGGTFGPVAVAYNGLIYIMGGISHYHHGPLGSLASYEPPRQLYTELSQMPTPRTSFGVGEIDGNLYAVGGYDGTGQLSGAVETYNVATKTWAELAPLPTPRADLSVAAVNRKLYAIGGIDANYNALAIVEVYDPSSGTWATGVPMPTPRFGLGTATIGNSIYAVGGNAGSPSFTDLETLEVFDSKLNVWAERLRLPRPRFTFQATAINGQLYVVGGNKYGCEFQPTYVYTP